MLIQAGIHDRCQFIMIAAQLNLRFQIILINISIRMNIKMFKSTI